MIPIGLAIRGGLAVAALIGLRLFAGHYYDAGVEKCQQEQAEADAKVAEIIPEISEELDVSQDIETAERAETYKEFHTGITQTEVLLARERGLAEGLKNGRKDVYDEIKRNGGCLAIRYAADSKLRNNARAIQQSLLESGIGSFEGTPARAGLSRGAYSDGLPEDFTNSDRQPFEPYKPRRQLRD